MDDMVTNVDGEVKNSECSTNDPACSSQNVDHRDVEGVSAESENIPNGNLPSVKLVEDKSCMEFNVTDNAPVNIPNGESPTIAVGTDLTSSLNVEQCISTMNDRGAALESEKSGYCEGKDSGDGEVHRAVMLSQDSGLEVKAVEEMSSVISHVNVPREPGQNESMNSESDSSTDSDSSDSGAESDSSTDMNTDKPKSGKQSNVLNKQPPDVATEEIKVKGEMYLEDLPPLEDLKITVEEDEPLQLVGHIKSVIGTLVVIEGIRDLPALNHDTMLFLEDRTNLGAVFEVFGPVASPYYTVRFNAPEDIERKNLQAALKIYCAPKREEYTHYVFVEQLQQIKGSDASWENDVEPPEQFVVYSDDEQERLAKAKLRDRDMTDEQRERKKQKNMKRKMKKAEKQSPGGGGDGQMSHGPRWPPGPPQSPSCNRLQPRYGTPPPWRQNRPPPPQWPSQSFGPRTNIPMAPPFGGPPSFGPQLGMNVPTNTPPWLNNDLSMAANPWTQPPPPPPPHVPAPPVGPRGTLPPWLMGKPNPSWDQPPHSGVPPPWQQVPQGPRSTPPVWGQPPVQEREPQGRPAIMDTRFINKMN